MVTEKPEIDPVFAYDQIASSFAQLTAQRRAYLDAVDRLVVSHLPPNARSLLDVGAGDGRRARAIGRGLASVVLSEPSAGMRLASRSPEGYIDLRAENLHQLHAEFDVILCLWNVLGHVFPGAARADVMRQFRRLLSPRGRIFVDVNHRYNSAQYGRFNTAARFLRDRLMPAEGNGDVIATWNLGARSTSVRGHVFTHREFLGLTRGAGLAIDHRFVVDYRTGDVRAHASQGNLLYIMKAAELP